MAARWSLDTLIDALAGFDREDGVSESPRQDEVPPPLGTAC